MLQTLTLETRRLPFKPRSVDDAERTVEIIASTGAGVARQDFDGPFLEVLSLKSGAVDLDEADGLPLLDAHQRDGLDRVLGVIRSARIEGGKLIVTAQISERHDAIWKDIKAGVLRNVSVGYAVEAFEDRTDPATGQRTRTITKWKLHEVSLVPVGADGGAKTRGSNMPETTPTPAPQTTTPPPAITRAEVNAEIRALADTFSLGGEFANPLIDREATIEQARAAALDHMRQASRPGPQARTTMLAGHDGPESFRAAVAEALSVRSQPGHQLSDAARPFANMTTLDIARHCLQRAGIETVGLSPNDVTTRALTTSDFPLILGDTARRTLRTTYEAAPAALKAVARQTTARDFRAKTAVQLGEAPTLEKVNEHGEYKFGSFGEAGETYSIKTFGKIIGLSRQAIVNDDLGAFSDLAGKFGIGAADFEAEFLVELLLSNSGNGPTMSDSNALFHTAHGNKAASGAALDETTLSAARLAMRIQTGLSGRPINAAPRFLLVPPELETTAEKLLATIQPATSADVNPFAGKLELLVEARLSSATRWYLTADPARVEGLEYAYLQGEEGPQIFSRAGFEIDGVETKVRLDFGAAFLDWRGWFMNPGA